MTNKKVTGFSLAEIYRQAEIIPSSSMAAELSNLGVDPTLSLTYGNDVRPIYLENKARKAIDVLRANFAGTLRDKRPPQIKPIPDKKQKTRLDKIDQKIDFLIDRLDEIHQSIGQTLLDIEKNQQKLLDLWSK